MRISEVVAALLAEQKKRGDVVVHFPVIRDGGIDYLPVTQLEYTDAPSKKDEDLFLYNPEFDESWGDG